MQGAALYSLLPCSVANVIYFSVFTFQVFGTTSSLVFFQVLSYMDALSVGTTIAFIVVPFLQLIMFWIDLVSGVGGMAYLSKPSLRYALFVLIGFTVCIEYGFRIAEAKTTAALDGEELNAFFVLGYRIYLLSLIISVSLFALFAVHRLRKSTAFGRQQAKRNAAAKGVKRQRGQVETITYYIWIIQYVSLAIIAITATYVAASFVLGKHSTALHMTYLILNDAGKIIFSIVALIILKPRKAVRVTKNMSEYSVNASSRRSVARPTVSSTSHSIQSLRDANAAASEDEDSQAALVAETDKNAELSPEEIQRRSRGETIHKSAKTGMKIRLRDHEPTAEELAEEEAAEDKGKAVEEEEEAVEEEKEEEEEEEEVVLEEVQLEDEEDADETEAAEDEASEPEPMPEPFAVPYAEPEPEAEEKTSETTTTEANDEQATVAPAMSEAARNSIAEEDKTPLARMSLAERRRAQGRPSIQARTGRATQQFGRASVARPTNRDSVAEDSDWVPLD